MSTGKSTLGDVYRRAAEIYPASAYIGIHLAESELCLITPAWELLVYCFPELFISNCRANVRGIALLLMAAMADAGDL